MCLFYVIRSLLILDIWGFLLLYGFSSLALQAIKILEDEMQCDIIKIGSLVRNKVQFNLSLQAQLSLTAVLAFWSLSMLAYVKITNSTL